MKGPKLSGLERGGMAQQIKVKHANQREVAVLRILFQLFIFSRDLLIESMALNGRDP
jgi:hypothetical protein